MNIGDRDIIPPKFEGGKDRVAYLLAEYKLGVSLAAAAGAVLLFTGRLGLPTLPPWAATGHARDPL